MARPRKQLDPKQVEQLAAINCSLSEAASVLDCSEDTIMRRYADVFKKGREHGKMSLKRKMWETAMGGNVTMQIWLSKQMLDYTDKHQWDITRIPDEVWTEETRRRFEATAPAPDLGKIPH